MRIQPSDDFEKTTNSIFKVFKTGFYTLLIMWTLATIVGLGLLGGLVYVAVHFLQKVW